MIFGQWFGKLSGDNNGHVLMSVDKLQEDKMGSISITPANDKDGFPAIARIQFSTVAKDSVIGILDMFLGFSSTGIIYPQSNQYVQMSSSGKLLDGKIINEGGVLRLAGKWETDLGFKGDVILQKVKR